MNTTIPYDLLLQLLRQTLGARVELADCRIGHRLEDYWVLLLELRRPDMRVVVKLAGPRAPYACPFDRTAMVHRLVAGRTTLTMPEILAVDVSYRDWPWRYLIKTHIPGQEWNEVQPLLRPEELTDAYQQMGEAVAQLHLIQFPAFGELALDGTVEGDGPYLAVLTEHVRRSIGNERLSDLFLDVLEQRRALFLDVGPARLCHEDLHRYNILFEHRDGKWRLSTILDFDKAWAGHHEIDLARLDLWRGMTNDAFWRSYRAVCPVAPQYPERRPVYQLLWCLEFASSTAQHLADTEGVCAELGIPRLEQFD